MYANANEFVVHLFQVDIFVDDSLVPLWVQSLLNVFGPSFVFSTTIRQHTTRGHNEVQLDQCGTNHQRPKRETTHTGGLVCTMEDT